MPRRNPKRNTKPTAKAGDCAQPNPKKKRRASKKKATKALAPASQTFVAVPNLILPPSESTQVVLMPPVEYPSFGDSGYPTDSMFATPTPRVAARLVGLPRPPTPCPSPAPPRQVMRRFKVTQKNVSTKCGWNAQANLQLANHMQRYLEKDPPGEWPLGKNERDSFTAFQHRQVEVDARAAVNHELLNRARSEESLAKQLRKRYMQGKMAKPSGTGYISPDLAFMVQAYDARLHNTVMPGSSELVDLSIKTDEEISPNDTFGKMVSVEFAPLACNPKRSMKSTKKSTKGTTARQHPSANVGNMQRLISRRASLAREHVKQRVRSRNSSSSSSSATTEKKPESNSFENDMMKMISQQVALQMADLRDRREQRRHEAAMAQRRMQFENVVDLTSSPSTTSSTSSSSSSSSNRRRVKNDNFTTFWDDEDEDL